MLLHFDTVIVINNSIYMYKKIDVKLYLLKEAIDNCDTFCVFLILNYYL